MKADLLSIKTHADELIDMYALTIPVHVFELADLMGIRWKITSTSLLKKAIIQYDPQSGTKIENWDDVLGFYDTKLELILLNSDNQHITRKRFTMAHELAHVQLHHDLNSLYRVVFLRQDIVTPRDTVEAEANYFAGYLLIPDRSLEQKLDYTMLLYSGEQIIQTFSKMFAVSPEAMRVRLKTFKKEHPELWLKYQLDEKLF
jgi:Zn-dependent peptidase ImmA (M78 family)